MYLEVAADGSLSLRESDNFRAFSIRERAAGSADRALAEIASAAEEGHYWLDAGSLVELSGCQTDTDWVAAYRAMLESVAPYGYYDAEKDRVKAHLESVVDAS